MDKIQNFLNNGNSEIQCDITKLANDEIGHLNDLDGIDCPICKNKGYILLDDDNGVTQSLVSCKCMHLRKVKRLADESGLGELLKHRVKNYEAKEEWQKKVKNTAAHYVRTDNNCWFCMLGQSGAGKTHICSAICNAFMEMYKDVRYLAWNDFATFYKENMKNVASKDLMREYQQVEVLYIDDLFKGADTEYDIKNIAFDLINYRYNNRLKTIISSERSFKQLCELDEAIAYRIAEMCQDYLIRIPKTQSNNYRIKKSKV
ncbi:DnaA ATPase domain-containing protein [Candidatus Stoquefichus massiliensis]|uniref:DnaA ATPase domain-containing protein n=1 Tax=Candidatus Stoquefichus massiliensis TaxID=1470350 RepID=UPI00048228DE|nr:DnaA/Hda family protein [Candidatus Stoquefichus massiliensis]